MTPRALHQPHIAARGVGGLGMVSLDSGYPLGLVVVDSNRPAPWAMSRPAAYAGTAGALRKQVVVATQ